MFKSSRHFYNHHTHSYSTFSYVFLTNLTYRVCLFSVFSHGVKWSEALGSHNFIFVFTFFFADSGRVIYTSEKEGSDESGDGSVQKPFKTVMQVGRRGFFSNTPHR